MGLGDFFRSQLSQVIEWKDQQTDVLIHKFQSENDEIKNASKLIIAPGQGVILIYEGKVTDHLTDEGIFNLESDNHPFITTFLKLRTNFESEHKLKIYFYRTSQVVNQGWGTSQAVKYVDPIYKIPIELGANGTFSFKITDPLHLFTNVVGSRNEFLVSEARELLQGRFPQSLSSVLASGAVSYQHIDEQLPSLSRNIYEQLLPEVKNLGFTLTDFKLNGTIFDHSTTERIGKIADITAESMAAAEGGLSYTDMEKLKALRDAARNEGGLVGAGLQLGVGTELGKTFHAAKEEQLNTDAPDIVTKLQQLKLLLDEKIITQEEYDIKKKAWLDKF
ncbi:membrane protease subunit (stomatin/prohibitin family) [Chryseobacterium sp. H1D6B]|uniref:SPFH domain-containing protein n=1 Tax=Chryseobacterium sp. H1D6B TaxID=2940588 RepID=UPI0015CEE6F7|nr:SPFH domain-containing protein [Chryseobacterium sp. H1D6B]MDH6252385.1 membrane protease subunit (stomatin/prohibitin family) [Chryseobacterium sp. H1D6B]